jgi:mono/diheme cytochrome c family protein
MKRPAAALGLAGTVVGAAGLIGWMMVSGDGREVARGRALYAVHCSSCHGAQLQGQPDWQSRRPDGRLPAPPHDERGHTWHHADEVLVGIIQDGLKPYAGQNYDSDMPAFRGILSEQRIRDILSFIKSSWPQREQEFQAQMTSSTTETASATERGKNRNDRRSD